MKLKITVDGKTYEVEVEVAEEPVRHPQAFMVLPSQARVPAAPAVAPAAAPDAGPVNEAKVCRSPITGTVVRVVAQAGQSIQPGDILLVLEAMKMETNITAPVEGKVKTITVGAGDGVKANQVVVELE
ncbi:acetyl-CoA carboxylase biotin carboxyl carrier protein subunit [Luteitalea sp. TBR-22]|uniref:biotin/lipoyl-containing protein n=1 Tax=Luteitalea sp. TBR-22 TaxID=2802971 RepID=UPI001AF8B8C1|nr:biotin/lipoyl-containing protein [Luteitalea sp. TBR-22]BCS34874.1 acetyl-CoA carboxylase biotin carboxyl carrier protein subunit [Luteitalea sp. TBR-22]